MSYVSEKVAFLKGLCEGMELPESKVAKLLGHIIETLEVIADEMDTTDELVNEMSEEIDALIDDMDEMDESLQEVEEIITDCFGCEHEDEDECDGACEDCDDEECSCFHCPVCDELIDLQELDISEEDGTAVCPKCNQEFTVQILGEGESCGCGDDDCGCGAK